VANTLSSIDAILTLRPERLALFGYAHVPWMKAHQRLIDESALPGPAERLAQSEAAAERLTGAGYVQIGLDHFALPEESLARAAVSGTLHRNFQGYTTDDAEVLLGFGASSISTLPQGFVQNLTQEALWRKAVADGELPVARGVALSDDDRFRGEIIERLMCDFEVDLAAVCARHGCALQCLEPEISLLPAVVRDGLAEWREPVLKVTAPGRPVVRSICTLFDAHLAPDARRHASAI
jgi:oxygen-independent coproporphyrinogen-3 oxidase